MDGSLAVFEEASLKMKNALRWLRVMVLPMATSACSVVPDAPDWEFPDWVDPTEWFGEQEPEDVPRHVAVAEEAVPVASFPELSTVPGEAPVVSTQELRDQQRKGLRADRANARYSTDPLTANATIVAPAPAPDAPNSSAVSSPVVPVPVTPAPVAQDNPVTRENEPQDNGNPALAQFAPSSAVPPDASSILPSSAGSDGMTVVISSAGASSAGALPPAFLDRPAALPVREAVSFNRPTWAPETPVDPRGYQAQYHPQTHGVATPGGAVYAGMALPTGRLVAVIYFKHGSAGLSDWDRGVLRDVVALYGRTGGQVRVVGHSSSRTQLIDVSAHQQVNYRMSANRAQAVRASLLAQGIPDQMLVMEARADQNPVFHEFMPTGEAGNRRVEIYLN